MSGRPAPVTAQDPDPGAAPSEYLSIGRWAALIAGLTVASRLLGLGRQLVFAHPVGTFCLGTAYQTANLVPNIICGIVIGGALASIMVPVPGRPAGRSARDPGSSLQVAKISSAVRAARERIRRPA